MARKRKKGAASLEEMAALEFTAWQHTEDEWKPPSNEEWAQLANPYLVTLRIAWITAHKTKPELIEILDKMDDDLSGALMERFKEAQSFFIGMQKLLDCAEARILIAGSSILLAEEAA